MQRMMRDVSTRDLSIELSDAHSRSRSCLLPSERWMANREADIGAARGNLSRHPVHHLEPGRTIDGNDSGAPFDQSCGVSALDCHLPLPRSGFVPPPTLGHRSSTCDIVPLCTSLLRFYVFEPRGQSRRGAATDRALPASGAAGPALFCGRGGDHRRAIEPTACRGLTQLNPRFSAVYKPYLAAFGHLNKGK